jgi:hypothetical protein
MIFLIPPCNLLAKSPKYILSIVPKTRTMNGMTFIQKSKGRNTEGMSAQISMILGLGYILGSKNPVITRTEQKCLSIPCRMIGFESLWPKFRNISLHAFTQSKGLHSVASN